MKKVSLSGLQLKQILEHSVEFVPSSFGGFLSTAGVTFSFNPSLPSKQRIIDIFINNQLIEDKKIYSALLTDFMCVGGDGYEMCKDLIVEKDIGILSDLIANYLSTYDGHINYSLGRIKIIN